MWSLATSFLGPMRSWPGTLLRTAVTVTQMTLGQVWRRFILRLSGFPYLLCPLVQEDVPRADKLALARQFCSAKPCCLDELFSQRLRNTVPCPEALIDDPQLHSFVSSCLREAMPTTTHVENGFAHMRRQLNLGWRAPSMHKLSADSVLAEHKRVHAAWVAKAKKAARLPGRQMHRPNSRPIWAWSKKRRQQASVSAFNEYVSDMFASASSPGATKAAVFRRLGQSWRELPANEKHKSQS